MLSFALLNADRRKTIPPTLAAIARDARTALWSGSYFERCGLVKVYRGTNQRPKMGGRAYAVIVQLENVLGCRSEPGESCSFVEYRGSNFGQTSGLNNRAR